MPRLCQVAPAFKNPRSVISSKSFATDPLGVTVARFVCLGNVRSLLRLKVLVCIFSLKSFATDPLGVAVARFAYMLFIAVHISYSPVSVDASHLLRDLCLWLKTDIVVMFCLASRLH